MVYQCKNNMNHLAGWWLSPTPLKNKKVIVGIMNFPIYGKMTAMFQTTNQMDSLLLLY